MTDDESSTITISRPSALPAEMRVQSSPTQDVAFAEYLGEHLSTRLRVAGIGLAAGAAAALFLRPESIIVATGVGLFGLLIAALPARWTAPAAPALAALFGVVTVGSVVLVPPDVALAVGLGLTFVLALVLPLTLIPRVLALGTQAAMVLILVGTSPLDLIPTAVVLAMAFIFGRQQERQWRALWEDREILATLTNRLHAESSHRKHAIQDREDELLAQQERMVQQEKWAALGRVAVGVGHEIKNPLQAAMSYLEMAREGDSSGIDDAFAALDQIRGLLLDLSQLRGANDVQEVQTFDLQALIDGSLRGGSLGLADIRVRRGTMPRVPVQANQHRLVQVLANLLTNAWKYTGQKKEIILRAHEENDCVVIGVRDNGIGIPEKEVTRIFEPFYRVDSKLTGKAQGAGLGLAIVNHLVRAHSGTVFVKTEEGEGSQFLVSLPIASTEEPTS